MSEDGDVASSSVVVAGKEGHAAVERGGRRSIGRLSRHDDVAMRGCGCHNGGHGRKRGGRGGVQRLMLMYLFSESVFLCDPERRPAYTYVPLSIPGLANRPWNLQRHYLHCYFLEGVVLQCALNFQYPVQKKY